MRNIICLLLALPFATGFACSDGGVRGAPDDQGVPTSPTTPAPTGTRWEEVPLEDACGRSSMAWVLVDEICGGTERADYAEAFAATMFRDGTMLGENLYAVDGSHLWVIDVAVPDQPVRKRLLTGVGRGVAMAAHRDRLVIASVDDGLVIVDPAVSEEGFAPSGVRLPLPGPALDVFVHSDRAFVAAGGAGLMVVNLASEPAPELLHAIAVPGFAAGVAVDGDFAYVAACDSLVVVDLMTQTVVGSAWIDTGDVAVRRAAPAKRVAVSGGVAFVAAGRYGAVAIDVTNPKSPQVIGNCTEAQDLSFHANGLRSDGEFVYVAAGEWGVLPIDVRDPQAGCASVVEPTLYAPPPPKDDECSFEDGWSLLPTEELWAPPQPGYDPLQVLIAGGHVFAFGDASRVSLRAIDIYTPSAGALLRAGRYEEPRLVSGIAARDGRVMLLGPHAGLFEKSEGAPLAPTGPLPIEDVVAGGFLADGRLVVASEETLLIEGRTHPVSLTEDFGDRGPFWAAGLHVTGDTVVVPGRHGVQVVRGDEVFLRWIPDTWMARLPPVTAFLNDQVYMASPEWDRALRLGRGGAAEAMDAHDVFGADEILNAEHWRVGAPSRVLIAGDFGITEVAGLGRRAGLMVHGSDMSPLALPAAPYVQGVAGADRLFLLTGDRRSYRSLLVTVDLGLGAPRITGIEAFSGVGVGLALDGEDLFVADADRGVRIFSVGSGIPVSTGSFFLGSDR